MLAFDLSTETTSDYRWSTNTLRGTFVSEDRTRSLQLVPSEFLPAVFTYSESNRLKNTIFRHGMTGVILYHDVHKHDHTIALFDVQSPTVRGAIEVIGINPRGDKTWTTVGRFVNGHHTLEVDGVTFVRTGRGRG